MRVTQEDREAAAAIVEWQNDSGWEPQFFHNGLPRGMREGVWDEHPLVLAFASHRLGTKAKRENRPRKSENSEGQIIKSG